VIVNSGQISVQDDDDYFPLWLQDAVTAWFDPIPGLPRLRQSGAMVPIPKFWELCLPIITFAR
jgi:hypothetical protein